MPAAGADLPVALTRSPCVVLHPTNISTLAGKTIRLTPGIGGISPLSWQWRKDGLDLPGANGRPLLKLPVGGRWHFSDSIESPDPRYRKIVKRFADAAYLEAESDDFVQPGK
jgi:hypothetical protein